MTPSSGSIRFRFRCRFDKSKKNSGSIVGQLIFLTAHVTPLMATDPYKKRTKSPLWQTRLSNPSGNPINPFGDQSDPSCGPNDPYGGPRNFLGSLIESSDLSNHSSHSSGGSGHPFDGSMSTM